MIRCERCFRLWNRIFDISGQKDTSCVLQGTMVSRSRIRYLEKCEAFGIMEAPARPDVKGRLRAGENSGILWVILVKCGSQYAR